MTGTWTCSEDEDFGSLGDNKVIVTGGTSGTPADFASFVTADRAGTAVLLAATNGASGPGLSLTYAIRPVEDLAVKITMVVASKTAHTDYVFITGTDAVGVAQTESIDVSAGNGSYESTKYFATVGANGLDCSDNSAGGGTVWADGTLRVTQGSWGFIWDYGLGQYRIDSDNFDFGDGSTSGYFTSSREQVAFNTGSQFLITNNQTVLLGNIYANNPINGSMWSFDHTVDQYVILNNGGTFLLYASIFDIKSLVYRLRVDGTITMKSSVWAQATNDAGGDWRARTDFKSNAVIDFERVLIANSAAFRIETTPTLVDVWLHRMLNGITVGAGATVNASGMKITSITDEEVVSGSGATANISLIDPKQGIATVLHTSDGAQAWEKYTCNIQVVDRDGAAIQSATVLCEDQVDAEAFSVSTDASGDIAEQVIGYKKWVDTTETLTTFSPHTFTISKAGYETLILEAITVDHPIVWHLELQTPKAPPRAWRH